MAEIGGDKGCDGLTEPMLACSTAHGSSQTCSLDHVVKCKEEIIGPLTLEGVLEGAQCWAIVLEPGEYDLRYVLEQHYGGWEWSPITPCLPVIVTIHDACCCLLATADVVFGGANALNVIATAKAVLEAIRTINEAGFVWRDAKPEVGQALQNKRLGRGPLC